MCFDFHFPLFNNFLSKQTVKIWNFGVPFFLSSVFSATKQGHKRRENSPHACEKMREPRRNVSTVLHLYTPKQRSLKQSPKSGKDWPHGPAYSITKSNNHSELKRDLALFGTREKISITFPQNFLDKKIKEILWACSDLRYGMAGCIIALCFLFILITSFPLFSFYCSAFWCRPMRSTKEEKVWTVWWKGRESHDLLD